MTIIKAWEIIQKGYEPKFTNENKQTIESIQEKEENDYAVNALINFVSESVGLLFANLTSAKDMWNVLITRYEGNTQIKRTKLTGLETKFENFRVKDGETVEDMYNRLMHIQNEFVELGEPLSNDKIVGKLLRIMLGRSKWEGLISALEAIQGTHESYTPDELYAHFRSFEEKLKQTGQLTQE